MKYLVQRLQEPSTYAGLGVALAAAGIAIPAGYGHDAALVGMVAAGVAAAVIKDGWRKALSSGDAANAVITAAAETGDTTKG
jgi:hypothetical protein